MADIHLGNGDEVYTQSEANRNIYDNIYGDDGNDVLKAFNGTLVGGRGNDRLEGLIYPGEPWRSVGAAYWTSPTGVVADLQGGWAEDGYGTRDTLVNIRVLHGSGNNDTFYGDAQDNFFYPNGGLDFIDGRDGFDGIDVREIPPSADGRGTWRPAVLSDLDIKVAVDGVSATITVRIYPKISYTLKNIEYLQLIGDNTRYLLTDFIRPQDLAEQGIAAGGAMRWNAASPLGTPVTLSYSFVTQAPGSGPGAIGFRPFSDAEKAAVRSILGSAWAVSGLSFTEVPEQAGSVGQLRFGASSQLATKGLSWLPNQAGAGDNAGDVWMDVESLARLTPGSEGWQALLHEIGHALGLRHPINVDAGDNWTTQLRAVDDRSSLTVMSSQPSSDGLFRSDWGPLDVLALRHLYGARTSNTGDSVYALNADHANAETALHDDGGVDTLDASALTVGATLDLRPGQLSSVGLSAQGIAGVENLGLTASTWIENAIGTPWDDVLTGNELANRLTGGLGNDRIDGGKGVDTAVFAGTRASYEVAGNAARASVKAADGSSGFDTLMNVERLQFSDVRLALDMDGAAGSVAGLIRAIFGASLLANREIIGIGLQLLDGGMTAAQLSALAMGTQLVVDLAGSHGNADVVRLLYRNAVGATPTTEQAAPFVAMLDNGSQTQGSLALIVAQHPLITGSVELVGLQATGIEYLPFSG